MTFLITFRSAEMLWGKSDFSAVPSGQFKILMTMRNRREKKKKIRQYHRFLEGTVSVTVLCKLTMSIYSMHIEVRHRSPA